MGVCSTFWYNKILVWFNSYFNIVNFYPTNLFKAVNKYKIVMTFLSLSLVIISFREIAQISKKKLVVIGLSFAIDII